MSLGFHVRETTLTPLWDFGWFDRTRFGVEGPIDERRDGGLVLEDFLRNPISQRWFCTKPDPWGYGVGLLGPYQRARLAVTWFRPLSPEGLRSRVMKVLQGSGADGSPSPQQLVPVEAWLEESRTRGDEVLALDAPKTPGLRVEWDLWLLFELFVCFPPEREEMGLVVFGMD